LAIATKPTPLTKPAANQTDTQFETIGTEDGFLVGWNRTTQTFPIPQVEVVFQRFDPNGKALGKPTSVEGPGLVEGLPEFVELGAGKYGLLWKAADLATGQIQLRAVVIDGDTGKAGAPVVAVEQRNASFIHDLARLDNGKVALVTRSSESGEDTTLTILGRDMKPVGKTVVVEDDGPGPLGAATYEQTVVSNGDGGVAIFRAADNQLKGVAFDGASKAGKAFQINTTEMRPLDFFGVARFNVKAEPLETGGFVVAWTAYDEGSNLNFDVYARVYGADGRPVGKDFVVHQDLSAGQSAPEILVFDRVFAAAWTDQATLGQTTQVLRIFDEDGKPLSDDIVTERFGADGAGLALPSVDTEYARLADGSYVKIFTAGAQIFADAVPEPKIGTVGADVLKGRAADEITLGAGGKDKLTGLAGADTLDGGADNDTLDGGAGADLLIGGAGADSLIGGLGADVFVFRPGGGADKVKGFDAGDRIDVSAFHYVQQGQALAAAEQVGKHVVVTLVDQIAGEAGRNVVKLLNTQLSELQETDFIL
jgi:Ca2+-binding RTX toxin-like protein